MNLYRISNCLSLYQLNELYRLYKLYELNSLVCQCGRRSASIRDRPAISYTSGCSSEEVRHATTVNRAKQMFSKG